MTDELFEQWVVERRSETSPVNLADQIMGQIGELDQQRQAIWWLSLVQKIERSRFARWAVCSVALAVGGLPFLFLAFVSKLLSF